MNKRIIHFSFVTFFSILLSFCAAAQTAINGLADLTQYNFDGDKPVDLSGTWEFYWNRLLTPEDFNINQNPEWILVPGSWHKLGNHSALGYATYRLRLLLSEKQNGLSIYFPIINSTAKIWIDNNLVEETGRVGVDKDHYTPKLTGTIVSLPSNAREVSIIVQAANFTYILGGISVAPKVDKTSALCERMNTVNGMGNFFAGSLMAMFIYQLILYFLYYRGKPHLWLALICLGVALRTMIVHGGSFLLPNLFPSVEWEYWKKIQFGSIYAIIAFFPLYVYNLFIAHAPKKPIAYFVGISIVLCLTVIVTPQYIYGRLLDICHAALLLTFVYALYAIALAWKAGNKDARIIFFGVVASFPFILIEILKNSILYPINIQFMYLVELGVFIFLLFQVYLLANHYTNAYRNLEILNKNLENIVQERTGQLTTANTVKDRLLSVMSHDVKSPLNSLRGILQIYNKGAITRDEFNAFAKQIENDLSKTGILVENILYWTTSQLTGVQVHIETFDLRLLIKENVQLFQTTAANKKLVLNHDAPKNFIIKSDRKILNFVLRNLLSNAIKYSFEGGAIDIHVSLTKHTLLIQVKDEGIGMDDETLQALTSPELTVSASGTNNEEGTGLGLVLCHDYLQRAGGSLTVESEKGKGSTFKVLLTVA